MQYNKGRKNKPSDPCLRIDLVFSKKGAKFAKSVKENILIIYAPLWWREERAPYCSKNFRLWV